MSSIRTSALEELRLLNPSPYGAFIESHVNPQQIFLMSQKCIKIGQCKTQTADCGLQTADQG